MLVLCSANRVDSSPLDKYDTLTMLWVDKYRPKTLDKLSYHPEITKQLKTLSANKNIPHMLFYGPSGAGKKTRIMALLQSIYGSGVERIKLEHRTFKTPNNQTVEINMLGSNFHLELNPSDVGNKDCFVVQEVIKEIAQFRSLDASSQKFKVIILSETDRLSKQAQAALRRTMEKYTSSCRLILCCERLSKVIDPVRSRCLCIRVGLPKRDEVCEVLDAVCKKESLKLPMAFGARVAEVSGRNLRRAILILEACKAQSYPFHDDQEITVTDWEAYIIGTAQDIIKEQSPQRLLRVRAKLYELLTNCIPADTIIKSLTAELLRKCDDNLKIQVCHWAAFYEHRLQCGDKEIYHLEAFVAKFMQLYKTWLVSIYG